MVIPVTRPSPAATRPLVAAANALVRPLADRWFMTDEEAAALGRRAIRVPLALFAAGVITFAGTGVVGVESRALARETS